MLILWMHVSLKTNPINTDKNLKEPIPSTSVIYFGTSNETLT